MPNITHKFLCNAFLDVTHPKDIAKIKKSYELLQEADEFKRSGNGGDALSKQNEAKEYSESGMTRALARVAFKKYKADPDNKIGLGFRYIKNVKRAKKFLIAMGVKPQEIVTICGDDEMDDNRRSSAARAQDKSNVARDFQTKRSVKVVITTIASGGQSIGLHDQIGCRPRNAFVVADDDITANQQFGGRFSRFGNQSIAHIFICYSKLFGPDQMRLYNNNVTKSAYMRKALETESDKTLTEREKQIYQSSIQLPGEYNRYFEPPSDKFEDRACLWDRPVWIEHEDEEYVGLYPPPKEHGFVEEDTKEGRRLYKDTKFMIDYVQSIWDQDLPADSINGIFFKTMPDKYFNQFDPKDFPNVTTLVEVP
jgi:hypothetical protein